MYPMSAKCHVTQSKWQASPQDCTLYTTNIVKDFSILPEKLVSNQYPVTKVDRMVATVFFPSFISRWCSSQLP